MLHDILLLVATLCRYRVTWTGPGTVGPSVSTFYSQGLSPAGVPAALTSFFTAIKGFWSADVTWTIPNSGDLLDDSDGHLMGGWTTTGGAAVTGSATGHNFILGAGARIVWSTNDIFARRRVKGSTFLTSMNAIEFQTDGTPQATTVASMGTACTNLITAVPTLAVWSRPVAHKPATIPPTFDRLGASHIVTSGALKDAASWLRSRRL